MPPRRRSAAKSAKAAALPKPKPSPEPTPSIVEKTDPEKDAVPPAAADKVQEPETVPPAAFKDEVAEENDTDPPTPAAAVQEVEEDVVSASPVKKEADEAVESAKVSEALADGKEAEDGKGEMDVEKGEPDNGKGANKLNEGDNSGSGEDAGNEEHEGDYFSLDLQTSLMERKKPKDFEIYIGGLNKEAVEDDLINVFSAFGEIQSVRIIKNPTTQRSKGFAFIRYATIEQTKKVLAELKEGTEVRGKQVRLSASQDKDTLYLGNICKTWTRDQVIEALKGFGVDQIENMILPDDLKHDGMIKGFAFLEFNSHSDAMAAFQRLRKPDAVFGCDRSAKVAFGTSMHRSEEALSEVRTVYVEGIPISWDEEKLKELCKQYGEIEKIQLSRNFTKSKRKDFGFVEFTSHESAVACVEGINNAEIQEGETKLKANIARPLNKGRLAKQSARGGFLVKQDGEVTEEVGKSKKKKNTNLKEVPHKGKAQSKLNKTKGSQSSKSQGNITESKSGSEAAQTVIGKKRGRKGVETGTNERLSKQARNNQKIGKMHSRPSNSFDKRNTYSGRSQTGYAGHSGSKRHHSDMEPHAGYLPARKHVQNPYGTGHIRAGIYTNQPSSISGYGGAIPVIQPNYPGYPSYTGYEAGYAYPSGELYAPLRPYWK